MPSSYHGHIADVIDLYLKANPKTVLDVGVGFGKWGVLFREYGDVFKGRPYIHDWRIAIDGVEAFREYKNPIYDFAYDIVNFMTIEKFVDTVEYSYDFIYAGDVIEHLEKDQAEHVLRELQKWSKQLVVTIPLGDRWPQGETFGNPFEAHKSTWTENDLLRIFARSKTYQNPAGKPIGLFYDSK